MIVGLMYVCMYVYSVVVMVCVEVLIFNCCVCTHVYVQPSPLHALHFIVYISMYVCMYVHNCVWGRGTDWLQLRLVACQMTNH